MINVELSRLLGERKLSQAELSRKTGIRANTINDLYHDMADRVSLDHIDRICEALNCSLTDLLHRTSNQQRRTGREVIVEECRRRRKPRCKG